jgi:hypothetical protein
MAIDANAVCTKAAAKEIELTVEGAPNMSKIMEGEEE